MSGGLSCKCEERRKPIEEREWKVLQLKCHHSAFAGYRRTPSHFSSVTCLICGAVWRTKSDFAYKLKSYEHKS